jgi:hypothetical protein
LLNLKFLSLLAHFFKENRQVARNLLRSFEVLGVFTSIELLTESLAHVINLRDGFRELHVRFFSVFKSDRAQYFKFFVCLTCVVLFLLFIELETFFIFIVRNTSELVDRLGKAG